MADDVVVLAVAGFAAGLGVAMPLGAIGVLVVREGMLRGHRSGLAAASGVATVDTLYCLGALLTGAALAPVIASWGDTPRYLSGVVIVVLGCYQLIALRRAQTGARPAPVGPVAAGPPAATVPGAGPVAIDLARAGAAGGPVPVGVGPTGPAGAGVATGHRSVYARFVLLTAINPLTLLYFFALAGMVTASTGTWIGPAVFVAAAGLASLLWQTVLAMIGAALGATVPPRVGEALGVVASLVVVALGVAVLVATART
ncbi:LysE family transporter [Micromonospora sp. WMMD987]|jgi:arginine exporter protein ArgO|uniref:LysE family transporter n=1 Tax=Micromonospora TaxID=1873 RepID=UPI00249BAD5D|nr:LysE family transporter [Micromonospora sp. WMMD987]WFE93220.1 LysE family transporter [Micromonospora sp. WMMD987]